MGMSLGHVDNSVLSLITLVGLVTIAASTYMILYSQPLYAVIEPWLSIFERGIPHREREYESGTTGSEAPKVIVYGLGRYGSRLMSRLEGFGVRVMGVDFDPEVVRGMRQARHEIAFGDAEDPEFPLSLPLGGEYARRGRHQRGADRCVAARGILGRSRGGCPPVRRGWAAAARRRGAVAHAVCRRGRLRR